MTASHSPQSADRDRGDPGLPFTMAFQPIFDLERGEIFAHEALLRDPDGGPAAEDPGQDRCRAALHVRPDLPRQGDRARRRLRHARGARDQSHAERPPDPDACIARTVSAAERSGFPPERIVFEFTEAERIADTGHLGRVVERYRACGFRTAVDDFGAGYSGLGLLAELQPDIIKVDMKLVRGLDADPVRQAILHSVSDLAARLGILVVAEGVETAGELGCLMEIGITLVQGFLLARPQIGGLVPAEALRAAAEAPRLAG
jgi:EAL domain-containing protein (putative c-di-GMP-specific phosphodiesterase class I)